MYSLFTLFSLLSILGIASYYLGYCQLFKTSTCRVISSFLKSVVKKKNQVILSYVEDDLQHAPGEFRTQISPEWRRNSGLRDACLIQIFSESHARFLGRFLEQIKENDLILLPTAKKKGAQWAHLLSHSSVWQQTCFNHSERFFEELLPHQIPKDIFYCVLMCRFSGFQ